ncbi:carbohydrate ABC transporter permease [Dactylosporangium sp. AC04546]|uniref:carbohydrate ABC transporter permease n=1 Tax=Dactylosporangium sp. AC04546 TaxID=2862460 RepID=UPI001EDD2BF9|nr:carbohydrate ABC transporter permease [Dactylosporangium sp. AC04546]WVK87189.1 carbohydrate ABC transporter permease [Dactylosporangium sp. AC04546]
MATAQHVLGAATAATPADPPPARRRTGRVLRRLPLHILITLLVVVEAYPLVWLVLGSFKTQDEFFSKPTWSLPSGLEFGNYSQALSDGGLGRNILNSLLVTVPALVLMLVLGVAAAYALEVLVWKGRGTVLLAFVAGIMIPGQMILVPLFQVYFDLGLTNTLFPLIITYTVMGLPLTVFLMAAYFRAVPREILESATVDGAGALRTFVQVAVPIMRNAIITIALVEFFSIWNDLLIALTFTTHDELATVQVGLLQFSDEYGSTQYGPLFAAISINVIGILVLYLFLSKQIMAGLAAGSVKG